MSCGSVGCYLLMGQLGLVAPRARLCLATSGNVSFLSNGIKDDELPLDFKLGKGKDIRGIMRNAYVGTYARSRPDAIVRLQLKVVQASGHFSIVPNTHPLTNHRLCRTLWTTATEARASTLANRATTGRLRAPTVRVFVGCFDHHRAAAEQSSMPWSCLFA